MVSWIQLWWMNEIANHVAQIYLTDTNKEEQIHLISPARFRPNSLVKVLSKWVGLRLDNTRGENGNHLHPKRHASTVSVLFRVLIADEEA